MERAKGFLADHYLTHRQGKAISAATNSYFSPAPAFYHSKIYLQLKELRTWREVTKNTLPGSNQILPTHYAPDVFYTLLAIYS